MLGRIKYAACFPAAVAVYPCVWMCCYKGVYLARLARLKNCTAADDRKENYEMADRKITRRRAGVERKNIARERLKRIDGITKYNGRGRSYGFGA